MLINENLDKGIAYGVRSYFVHKTKSVVLQRCNHYSDEDVFLQFKEESKKVEETVLKDLVAIS